MKKILLGLLLIGSLAHAFETGEIIKIVPYGPKAIKDDSKCPKALSNFTVIRESHNKIFTLHCGYYGKLGERITFDPNVTVNFGKSVK